VESTVNLHQFHNWRGTLDELSSSARKVLSSVQTSSAIGTPSTRLSRDYVRRGIIDAPRRAGREAHYGYRQLLQLVAARLLILDGWPLAKISEQFGALTDRQLEKLIIGEERRRTVANEVGGRADLDDDETIAANLATSPPAAGAGARQDSKTSAALFSTHASRASAIKSETLAARKRLLLRSEAPLATETIRFEIAPWCHLLVECARLSELTFADAENLGRAVHGTIAEFLGRKRT
jgi:hypothetical protein